MKFRCLLKDVKVSSGDVKEIVIKISTTDRSSFDLLDATNSTGYLEFVEDKEPELDFDEEEIEL